MEELYINGNLVYLSDRVVSRTLQVNDFREVKDRQANFSNSIKIPKTPENIKTFEYLGVVGNISTISYNNISVKYVLDGIEMVTDGKGVIKSTNEFYDFNFYDGNVSLSQLLGNQTLATLDYSAYNHNLTYANFFSSGVNTSGYIYGLNGGSLINIGQTSPSFYIHTLIDMMFTQKGWSVEGDIFIDPDYLSRVMTMDVGFENDYIEDKVNKYTQVNSAVRNNTYTIPTTTAYLVDSYTTVAENVFNIAIVGDVSITFGTSVELEVRLNGISQGLIYSSVTTETNNLSVYAEIGDIITVYAVAVAEQTAPSSYKITFTENFTTTVDEDNSYYVINFNDIIGTTKQIDLLKDVMQRFNLSFRKLNNENKLEFIKSDVLLADKVNAENWSSKYSNKINEITKSKYARQNDFKYIYDVSGNNYADGSIDLTDVNLPETKSLVSSIFKASSKSNGVYGINLWSESDGVYTSEQDGSRIFKIDINNVTRSYRLSNTEGYFVKTGNAPFLDFSGLYYQSEIDNNYTEFTSLLNTYKMVVAEFNLSIVDIYQLDFFKLKYIEQTGKFYYLNKVVNFKNNKTTKVELIEIPI